MLLVVFDLLSLLPWISALFRKSTPLSIPLNYAKDAIDLNPEVFSEKLGYDFLTLNNLTDLVDWVEYEIKPLTEYPLKPLPEHPLNDETSGQHEIFIPFHNHTCKFTEYARIIDQDESMPSTDDIFARLESLKSLPCLTFKDKYWKFEYCHLRKVRQSDTETQPSVYNLGHYFPKDPKNKELLFDGRVFALNYKSGDKCVPHAPHLNRSTQVRFTCDPKISSVLPEITSVFEVSMCQYIVSINVPSLCDAKLRLSKSAKSPHNTLFCGGLEEQHNTRSDTDSNSEVSEKAHAMWISKVANLLNSENPHRLLARALLDIRGDFNLLRATHPRNTLNVFAIKAMQHRIEEAIRDLKRRPSDSKKQKKKFFITTFTEEQENDGSKKEKNKRRTFKIEL